MKKSELIAAIQKEILRHDFGTGPLPWPSFPLPACCSLAGATQEIFAATVGDGVHPAFPAHVVWMVIPQCDDHPGRLSASNVPASYLSTRILTFGIFRNFRIVPTRIFDFLGRNIVHLWHKVLLRGCTMRG